MLVSATAIYLQRLLVNRIECLLPDIRLPLRMLALVGQEVSLDVRIGEAIAVRSSQISSVVNCYAKLSLPVLQADANFSCDGVISLDATFTVQADLTATQ